MSTYTLNDNIIMFTIIFYYIMNTVSTGKVRRNVVCVHMYVCMCERTRESAFSLCLKTSSMMHDDRTGSLLDAVSLSVNDRVDCHLKHHSICCKNNVHFDTIVLNSSKHPPAVIM